MLKVGLSLKLGFVWKAEAAVSIIWENHKISIFFLNFNKDLKCSTWKKKIYIYIPINVELKAWN